jgi:hypothetical protein
MDLPTAGLLGSQLQSICSGSFFLVFNPSLTLRLRIRRTSLPHVKFILPNASIINVHVPIAGAPGETQLPAWWDPFITDGIRSVWAGKDTPVNDVEGFKKATANLEKIIEEEAKLVAPGRVILGGFSQGTVLSLAVGLENSKVGGIIGKFFYGLSFEDIDMLIFYFFFDSPLVLSFRP